MNKIIKEITNCHNCEFCDHNGLIQDKPKYICHHNAVKGRNKVDANYWYDMPVLCLVNKKHGEHIDIPNWCPLLEDK